MIKSELINQLAKSNPGVDPKIIADTVNTIIDYMSESLTKGQRIEIRDFGCWFVQYRAERTAHNPRTGKKVKTQPRHSPRFKPGKELRERVDASKET